MILLLMSPSAVLLSVWTGVRGWGWPNSPRVFLAGTAVLELRNSAHNSASAAEVITFKASNMILNIHSNASYLSKNNTRSRAGGHHFLSDATDHAPNNGAVLNISSIIKNVMSSAAEAKLGALFLNAKTAVPARKTLEELDHPQPRTPIQMELKTAKGLINNKIISKATKSIDMKFHWLCCCGAQGQFRFYWGPGT